MDASILLKSVNENHKILQKLKVACSFFDHDVVSRCGAVIVYLLTYAEGGLIDVFQQFTDTCSATVGLV